MVFLRLALGRRELQRTKPGLRSPAAPGLYLLLTPALGSGSSSRSLASSCQASPPAPQWRRVHTKRDTVCLQSSWAELQTQALALKSKQPLEVNTDSYPTGDPQASQHPMMLLLGRACFPSVRIVCTHTPTLIAQLKSYEYRHSLNPPGEVSLLSLI